MKISKILAVVAVFAVVVLFAWWLPNDPEDSREQGYTLGTAIADGFVGLLLSPIFWAGWLVVMVLIVAGVIYQMRK